jgi:hypothetical protein
MGRALGTVKVAVGHKLWDPSRSGKAMTRVPVKCPDPRQPQPSTILEYLLQLSVIERANADNRLCSRLSEHCILSNTDRLCNSRAVAHIN